MTETSMPKPHVLIIITKADIGGAQIHVLSLIDALSKKFRFTLASGEEDFLTRQARLKGVDVVILKNLQRSISLYRDYQCYCELKSLIRQLSPSMVHLHSTKAGVVGRLAAWATDTPSLFTAHGWAFTNGVGRLRRVYATIIEWTMARFGTGIISVSEYDFTLAERFGIKPAKGHWLVRNCVPEVELPAVEDTSPEPVSLLNIGRITTQKNQLMLIEAVSQIEEKFQLNIIGSGVLKEDLEKRVKQLKLEECINIVENTPEIAIWYAQAQIFVLSSRYEGMPLCILEAMSAGLPVVSTNVGGISEAVQDGVNGYLVEAGDVLGLRDKIRDLILNEADRNAFAENSQRLYKEKFTVEKMCNQTLRIYDLLLESNN